MNAMGEFNAPDWTLARLFETLRRRSVVVLTGISTGFLLASLYLAFAEDRYTASASLLPDTRSAPPAPIEIDKNATIDPAVVESQIETIRSEKIALAVIDKLGLLRDPEFVGDLPRPLALVLASTGLRRLLPDTETVRRRRAVGSFLQMLDVSRIGRSYVTKVSFTSNDPAKAATIANEIADAYIQDQLGSRFSYAERTSQWIQQRIASLEGEAIATARVVESFKRANGIMADRDGKTADERELDELLAALESARADVNGIRSGLETTKRILDLQGEHSGMPSSTLFEALGSRTLIALRKQYDDAAMRTETSAPLPVTTPSAPPTTEASGAGSRSSDIRARIWAEVHAIEAKKQTELSAATGRVGDLQDRIQAVRQRIAAGRPQLERLRELEANHKRVEQLRDFVQKRFARIADFVQQQSLPATEAHIVAEAAAPLTRSWPKIPVVLLLGFCGGLAAGVGGALVREASDRKIRRPDQFESDLDIRCIGSLPCVCTRRAGPNDSGGNVSLAVARWTSRNLGDRLRAVMFAVDESLAGECGKVIGIVSAEPGVGKTTVALSLAVAAAGAGRRILLLDADLRKPDLTRGLAPESSAGLTAVLDGKTSPANGIISHFLGFHLLGQHPPISSENSADVLSSRAMQNVVQDLRKAYDYILIDTPAMLDRIDVPAAAKLFDAVLLVTEQGRTRIDDLDRALAICNRIRGLVVGAVMNKSSPVVKEMDHERRAAKDLPGGAGNSRSTTA
jgi:succinoglycan biosynthesis transport protein ExoP